MYTGTGRRLRFASIPVNDAYSDWLKRSYWYARGEYEYDESQASDTLNPVCVDAEGANCTNPKYDGASGLGMPLSRKNWIDYEVSDENSYPKVCSFILTFFNAYSKVPMVLDEKRRPTGRRRWDSESTELGSNVRGRLEAKTMESRRYSCCYH